MSPSARRDEREREKLLRQVNEDSYAAVRAVLVTGLVRDAAGLSFAADKANAAGALSGMARQIQALDDLYEHGGASYNG